MQEQPRRRPGLPPLASAPHDRWAAGGLKKEREKKNLLLSGMGRGNAAGSRFKVTLAGD